MRCWQTKPITLNALKAEWCGPCRMVCEAFPERFIPLFQFGEPVKVDAPLRKVMYVIGPCVNNAEVSPCA